MTDRILRRLVSRSPLGCLVEVAETLVLTVVIFLLIQTFVAQPFQVDQISMETTLEPGQYVLVDKLTPRFDDYSRGDIVVFRPPAVSDDAVPFIKRVIGEPGDHVELRESAVYVNGQRLDEPYIREAPTEPHGDETSWDVPPDSVFVMGDNRQHSVDSRADRIGTVRVSDVIGRAWLRYWPITSVAIFDTPSYLDQPVEAGWARQQLPPPPVVVALTGAGAGEAFRPARAR